MTMLLLVRHGSMSAGVIARKRLGVVAPGGIAWAFAKVKHATGVLPSMQEISLRRKSLRRSSGYRGALASKGRPPALLILQHLRRPQAKFAVKFRHRSHFHPPAIFEMRPRT